MRVAIYTLGCKVNQYESHALEEAFRDAGWEVVPFGRETDCVVVNTCAVTARAAAQSRQILRRARRTFAEAKIVATGCYAQIGAQEILATVPDPICVVGNDQKDRLPHLVEPASDCLEIYLGDISRVRSIGHFQVRRPAERTRAYLRVQDGCHAFCSYCIVPYSRGRSRSLPVEEVHEQVEIFEAEGLREVVVTGIHIGLYGADLLEKTSILDLLRGLCEAFPEIRFRLSSIEPNEVTPEMLDWATHTPNFCPHWHIPLQSGSDSILSRMNRRYTSVHYRALIRDIHRAMPHAAIGADVLVGFPGEDEEAFSETYRLLSDLPMTYVHAFPYSRRPGTLAAAMPDSVSKADKSKRVGLVRALGQEKRMAFYQSQIGAVYPCLMEQKDKTTKLWRGYTPNYIPVLLEESDRNRGLKNRVLPVRLTQARGETVFGTRADR